MEIQEPGDGCASLSEVRGQYYIVKRILSKWYTPITK